MTASGIFTMECLVPPVDVVGDETPLAIAAFLLGYLLLRFVKSHSLRFKCFSDGVPGKMQQLPEDPEKASNHNSICDEELLICAKEIAALRGASPEELAGIVKALSEGRGLPVAGKSVGG
mmetsp:Transcript_26972/g.46823  ORF Transcript_26972/g.46823 Transcript_26972/m.46823 type:complete len:120 (+) Transcript_26972:233-592(+)